MATIQAANLKRAVSAGQFADLFVGELNWDNAPYPTLRFTVSVNGVELPVELHAIAHKRGVIAFETDWVEGSDIRRRIAREVQKRAHEYLIVFRTKGASRQVWHWPYRQPGKPSRPREIQFNTGENAARLLELLNDISFDFASEGTLTLTDVTKALQKSASTDKVTKKFYDEFAKRRTVFMNAITGIGNEEDRKYYTAIMLNRLMFTWFLQSKSLLNDEDAYLQTKLDAAKRGELRDGSFQSFYRSFLRVLFHEGLNGPEVSRSSEVRSLIGNIPYVNGGIFDMHSVEKRYSTIDIPNEAFESVFAFFRKYTWHLDDRPLGKENEINPDVLGFIFEKFVNSSEEGKSKGAYYTKEDVTGYMSQNTILPWILEQVGSQVSIAFSAAHAGNVWELLSESPERYIYRSMKKGILEETSLKPKPLPEWLENDLKNQSQGVLWNSRAGKDFGHETETWREYIYRRNRTLAQIDELRAGRVQAVSDLIDLNLDIRQFVQDIVSMKGGVDLVRALWQAANSIKILDPTVGSGAFLFSALGVLEPIYTGLIARMEEIVAREPHERVPDILSTLEEIRKHPRKRYYVLRTIIINNLFGVDIEAEAIEICKLRLFLHMISTLDRSIRIEPLPDLDFNLRTGNAIVGYSSWKDVQHVTGKGQIGLDFGNAFAAVEEAAHVAEQAYTAFRDLQLSGETRKVQAATTKSEYQKSLKHLRQALEHVLPRSNTQAGLSDSASFHWIVEFHEVLAQHGGFDVIIGNPPYVSTSNIRSSYSPTIKHTIGCPNIYAMVLERCTELLSKEGRMGLIVPLSLSFSGDFAAARRLLSDRHVWASTYDILPAPLFTGAAQRCTILLSSRAHGNAELKTTKLNRWRSATREHLLQLIEYFPAYESWKTRDEWPKHGFVSSEHLLEVIQSAPTNELIRTGSDDAYLGYAKAALNFVSVFNERPPLLDGATLAPLVSKEVASYPVRTIEAARAGLSALAGELYMWYWWTRGDGFHVTNWMVKDFAKAAMAVEGEHLTHIVRIGEILHRRRNQALVFKHHARQYVGNFNYRSLHQLTRRSDLLLLNAWGIDSTASLGLLDFVQRVLLVNELAGEKGIPANIKKMFEYTAPDGHEEAAWLREADEFLCMRMGLDADALLRVVSPGYPQWPPAMQ